MIHIRPSWLGFALVGTLLVVRLPQSAAQSPLPENGPADSLTTQQKIDRLASELDRAQQQVDAIRAELNALRRQEQARTPATLDAPPVAPAQDAPESTVAIREEQELHSAQIRQQQQVKVESSSRFPVYVTGLVLFNTVRNYGVVDEVDLPTGALSRRPGTSHGSTAASLRQTWLGITGTGPVLGGARTSARIDIDFFGGVIGGVNSAPAGIVRLRTGAIRADWAHDTLEARMDAPLISPRSPTSIANVAEPSLAWAGNLWTWSPELRYAHTFDIGGNLGFMLEAGLRDKYLANTQIDQVIRSASPGELSGQPGYEGRISFGTRSNVVSIADSYGDKSAGGWVLALGGYFGRQDYGEGVRVDTSAITGDWVVPLRHWLILSGEAYTGSGLGGLGGGAYRDVVQGTNPVTGVAQTYGLNASGGWTQFSSQVSPRIQINVAFGQDSGSGRELRALTLPTPSTSLGYYARNRATQGNIIYRPWSSFTLSPEYRFLQSWPINGYANVAHIFTLSAGYQF